jgi:hypothetical protein
MISWRCHSNSVNTGSRLPICSDVKTRKRRNVVGIDMIRNNRIDVLRKVDSFFCYIVITSSILIRWWWYLFDTDSFSRKWDNCINVQVARCRYILWKHHQTLKMASIDTFLMTTYKFVFLDNFFGGIFFLQLSHFRENESVSNKYHHHLIKMELVITI